VLLGVGTKQLYAVSDSDGGLIFFAATDISHAYLASGLACGYLAHQLITVLYLLAVQRDDGVTGLKTGSFRRAFRGYTGNDHATLHAVHTGDSRIRFSVEYHADRSAGHTIARADELVVNVCHRLCWKREAHTL